MTQLHAVPVALAGGALVGAVTGVVAAAAAGRATGRPDVRRRWAAPALAVGAIAGAGIGARFGVTVALAAYLLLVAVALPLSAIDLAVRKVPDRILLPVVPAAVVLLALAAGSASSYGAFWRAILAGAVSFLTFLTLAVITQQLGLGDVKLAGLLGIFLGFLGWTTVWLGTMIAFGLAAVYVVARRFLGSRQYDRVLPFGPALLLGALAAVIVS